MKKIFIFSFPFIVIGAFVLVSIQNSINQQRIRYEIKAKEFSQMVDQEKRKNGSLELPILLYHYVEIVTDERDTIRQGLSITPLAFESQIISLLTTGYEPIHLKDLMQYYDQGAPLPKKPIILTFDDGFRDFYTDVFPILQKYHVPATIFIVSSFIDSTHNYLTQEQLLKLSKSELIEIGSHSVTHMSLENITFTAAKEEIWQSKDMLEKMIGKKVRHFAYPYGVYNSDLAEEVEKAGYLTASKIEQGIMQTYDQRFFLKRIKPGGFTGQDFLSLLK